MMRWNPLLQRATAALLSVTMAGATWAQTAPVAGPLPPLVSTERFTAPESAQTGAAARQRLLEALDRADVVTALTQRGLSPDQARDRVAALSDSQALDLAAHLDRAPAGSSEVLSAALFIFVLLLITDILGFTKVFPFTRSVR
jgi:hypothetical protein